jgi:integrase
MGCVYRQKNIWWIKYYRNGKPVYESSESRDRTTAKRLLKVREGDTERGEPVLPKAGRLRFDEAAQDLVNEYTINHRQSLDELERRLRKHLMPFFGGHRMTAIGTADVRAFTAQRLTTPIVLKPLRQGAPPRERPVSNGEINRELTALKRMFHLAKQNGKLLHVPYIPMLREQNVRTGFFEREQYEAILPHLPAPLRPMVAFAYITGWRIPSEVLTLQRRQIDFGAEEVRLDPGTTKNREGRVFPFTAELRDLLATQCAENDRRQRETGKICPWVFHRDGKRIKSFLKAFKAACKEAGYPGHIPHDFRRTAVRNLVRAGVIESVAMKMTGHKTRSVFERYNIVSEGDLRDAARKLDAARNAATIKRQSV